MLGIKGFVRRFLGILTGRDRVVSVTHQLMTALAATVVFRCPACGVPVLPHQIHVGVIDADAQLNGAEQLQQWVVTHVSCAGFAPESDFCGCAACDIRESGGLNAK